MDARESINYIKGLIIDGVGKANSGHPGGAMSSIDFAYILFSEYLQFDPEDPEWQGRDRFILSAGHESMLIYSLSHLNGWLEMSELENFRQLHSKTPGHPENILTPGVECTTGPLGQGAAMSIGFAYASRHLSAKINSDLFSYKTYALLGDGCIQEDVTLGAASLAGHLNLNNLLWYYDRNKVQISGKIDRVTSDDESLIFKGFGWDVIEIDGHDHDQIRATLDKLSSKQEKPTLVIGNTTMAKGSAHLEGSPKAHGAPFSAEETKETKKKLGLDPDSKFNLPTEVYTSYRSRFSKKGQTASEWKKKLAHKLEDPSFKDTYNSYFSSLEVSKLPALNWEPNGGMATRNSFGMILETWANELPRLVGGSADLEPSNMTGAFAKIGGDFSRDNPSGRNIAFGVREFVMSAMCNGIALHGGLIPFDATFLTFSDYSRPALRLGAIQEICVLHEFTHDSIYLGEDGPTHQPIEHIMSLRSMPNFYVMRPADSIETEAMFRVALTLHAPSAHCLSRQNLPHLPRTSEQTKNIKRGAYILSDSSKADVVIFATGSEVQLALKVAQELKKEGKESKVVSVPCWELFDEQDDSYKKTVYSWEIKNRVSIEAGSTLGWQKFVGSDGIMIGIDRYGASAPAEKLEEFFGFTVKQVKEKILGSI